MVLGEYREVRRSLSPARHIIEARVALASAWSVGGYAVGLAFQKFGEIGEGAVAELLEVLEAETSALIVRNQSVQTAAGQRVIDFFVQLGQRSALLEIKYGIPGSAQAYDRLLSQLSTSVQSGTAQQVVLVLVRTPTFSQLATLGARLGVDASGVTVVTVGELQGWLSTFFGVYF